MKSDKLVLILLLLFLLVPQAQFAQKKKKQKKGGQNLPELLELQYRQDAARLSLRDLKKMKTVQADGAFIPKQSWDDYQELLKIIYFKSKSSPEIPDLSSIHTLGSPHLKKLRIVLEKSCSWLERWSNGYSTTDNLYLNQLISKYGLKTKEFKQGIAGPEVIMQANDYINTEELARLLSDVDGIKYAETVGVIGDGNNIKVIHMKDGSGIKIVYTFGFDDCPSGCIHRSFWTFMKDNKGILKYLGVSGDKPPANWQEN